MDGIKLMLVLMLLSVLGLKQAAECGKIHAKGVSKKEAELIVKRHNDYRKLIANGTVPGQPRGINLKRMFIDGHPVYPKEHHGYDRMIHKKYDARLAAKAQKVADTCTFAHKSITDRNGVSETDQETIVNVHNDYRLSIANGSVDGQPRGIDLKRLTYDAYLAQKAQEISDTTVFAHVSVPDDRFSVGQNLYMFMTTVDEGSSDWPSAIKSWFDEHSQYTYGACCSSETGHYTQVIWHDTEFVGCGYTYFSDPSQSLPYRKLYVCNYGPAGNWVGEFPYQTGDSGCENLC